MKRVNSKRNHREEDKTNAMRRHSVICELKGDLTPKKYRYRGIALAWTALVITALLLIVGLSLDVAKLAYNIHQMQNATDAAALAGAQIVKTALTNDTQQFTHELAFANKAEHLDVTLRMAIQPEPFTVDQNSFDILIGRWVRYNRTFIPTLDAPNAVQAVARRSAALGATEPALKAIKYIFGPLAGVDTADAATLAVGWAYSSGGAGLICLDPNEDPGLLLSGTADVDVDGGGIHVNSTAEGNNSTDGTWISGNALLDCGYINVVGGITPEPDSDDWVDIFEGGDEGVGGYSVSDVSTFPQPQPIADPLAAKMMAVGCPYVDVDPPTPAVPGSRLDLPALIDNGTFLTHNIPTVTTSMTLGPGYYPNGMSISNGVDITLAPTSTSGLGTIFIFGGGTDKNNSNIGLYMTGGTLTGHGVTCYVTQNFSSGVYGLARITGGDVDLDSPGDWQNEQSGEFNLSLVSGLNGIAVWQDSTNPNEAHLNGEGSFSISGTIYFPDPIHLRLEGNLGDTGNQILCGSAEIHGTAVISVNYDNRNQGEASSVCLVR